MKAIFFDINNKTEGQARVEMSSKARTNSVQTDIDGVKVQILGYEDLIRKESAARAKDVNDAEELRKRNSQDRRV